MSEEVLIEMYKPFNDIERLVFQRTYHKKCDF